nr:hypothetical protein 11 [Gammaproteobacteria bacterium]
MIKLERGEKPAYLDDDKVEELTEEFKSTGRTVWNRDEIKEPLLASSERKCAYCECDLTKESNYMEVEHFEDKKHNPEKVVIWENLLPSCKKCNGRKGTHDVTAEPIVNPYNDDPRKHLGMRLYRLRGLTATGESTIEVAGLNNSARLVMSRFKVGEKISDLLDTARERFDSYVDDSTTRRKNRVISIVEGMLMECQPSASFSASTSTILLSDQRFNDLVEGMRETGIWDDEIETLYQKASSLVLKSV